MVCGVACKDNGKVGGCSDVTGCCGDDVCGDDRLVVVVWVDRWS